MDEGSNPSAAVKYNRKEMKTMRNLIKHKMLDLNREDFIGYLSELLNCSRVTASNKMNGNTKFTEEEIRILTVKLEITAEELKNAIVKE